MINFNSCKLKIIRANQHITEIEKWCKEFADLNPHPISIEFNDKGIGIIKVTPPRRREPQGHIGTLIGDAVHNLRAALDHLASAICIAHGADPVNATFPIDRKRERVITQPKYAEIERLSSHMAIQLIDAVGSDKTWDALVGLNHLDRTDKHRIIITHSAITEFCVDRVTDANQTEPFGVGHLVVIAGTPDRLPELGTRAHTHNERYRIATPTIIFGKGEPFEGEPILPTLVQLAGLVARIGIEFEKSTT